jgi:hypothetical protein
MARSEKTGRAVGVFDRCGASGERQDRDFPLVAEMDAHPTELPPDRLGGSFYSSERIL